MWRLGTTHSLSVSHLVLERKTPSIRKPREIQQAQACLGNLGKYKENRKFPSCFLWYKDLKERAKEGSFPLSVIHSFNSVSFWLTWNVFIACLNGYKSPDTVIWQELTIKLHSMSCADFFKWESRVISLWTSLLLEALRFQSTWELHLE